MVFVCTLEIHLSLGKAKKQETVSRSTTESEYRALAAVSCEVAWIIKNLDELKLKDLLPVEIYCDNVSAIKLALNPVFHEKTKHFELDVNFIRDKITKGLIKVVKIDSDPQIADLFTKSLNSYKHNHFSDQLGLIDPFSLN